jgi:hypothetical protein
VVPKPTYQEQCPCWPTGVGCSRVTADSRGCPWLVAHLWPSGTSNLRSRLRTPLSWSGGSVPSTCLHPTVTHRRRQRRSMLVLDHGDCRPLDPSFTSSRTAAGGDICTLVRLPLIVYGGPLSFGALAALMAAPMGRRCLAHAQPRCSAPRRQRDHVPHRSARGPAPLARPHRRYGRMAVRSIPATARASQP